MQYTTDRRHQNGQADQKVYFRQEADHWATLTN